MLIPNLLTIQHLAISENQLTVKVNIDGQHTLFDGHFPNQPITPGVVQIQVVKEILDAHFKANMVLKTMSRCKFLAVLNPFETPEITVQISFANEANTCKISASGFNGDQIYFKFNASYEQK